MHCQQQENEKGKNKKTKNDASSGIYAFVFAVLIAYEMNPSEPRFKMEEIKEYMMDCLRTQSIHDLPNETLKTPRKYTHWKPRKIRKLDVYCHCRMPYFENDTSVPERFQTTVACSQCGKDFHETCEEIPIKATEDRKEKWYCSECTAQNIKDLHDS